VKNCYKESCLNRSRHEECLDLSKKKRVLDYLDATRGGGKGGKRKKGTSIFSLPGAKAGEGKYNSLIFKRKLGGKGEGGQKERQQDIYS